MSSSKAVLIAAIALLVGFLGGLASGAGNPRPLEEHESFQALQQAMQDKNTQFLKLARERANLIGQVRVLERMVDTQQAQLDEINAVIGPKEPGELNLESIQLEVTAEPRGPTVSQPRYDLIDVVDEQPGDEQ